MRSVMFITAIKMACDIYDEIANWLIKRSEEEAKAILDI